LWDESSYYGVTGVVTSDGDGNYEFLGEDLATGDIDPEKIAFSPNGDGIQDDSFLMLSLLRNAKEASFQVLDEDQEVIRTIRKESDLRKNYYDNGSSPHYSLSSTW